MCVCGRERERERERGGGRGGEGEREGEIERYHIVYFSLYIRRDIVHVTIHMML